MTFPCSLVLESDISRYLSFSIRNNSHLPSTALPVFRSPKHARDFERDVLQLTDTRSLHWTVSLCRNTKEATFHTFPSKTNRNTTNLYPKLFDIDDDAFIKDLLLVQIGCLIVDSYRYNLNSNGLTVEGVLWIPESTAYINLRF